MKFIIFSLKQAEESYHFGDHDQGHTHTRVETTEKSEIKTTKKEKRKVFEKSFSFEAGAI